MTYSPEIEKILKVKMYGIVAPTTSSEYSVGSIFKYEAVSNQSSSGSNYGPTSYYTGNLTGLSLDTHTNSSDTIVLPAGRYYVQCTVQVVEKSSSAYFEWQLHSASSLNGTYSAFGIKGRNNPGSYPDDSGDNEGVHKYAAGILESNDTSYLQTRVVSNSNYTSLSLNYNFLNHRQMIIWRAD